MNLLNTINGVLWSIYLTLSFLNTIFILGGTNRSDFFCVRTVNRSELIHATPKELECIFQLRSSNVGTGSTISNFSVSDLQKKVPFSLNVVRRCTNTKSTCN